MLIRSASRNVARKVAQPSTRRVLNVAVPNTRVPARNVYGSLYGLAKKVMPAVSATERAALECGTVGFDRELFGGDAKLASLNKYTIELSDREVSIFISMWIYCWRFLLFL